MLILSRKQGQKLIINDSIVLTVLDLANGNIKLGIDAPPGVKVYREEIYNAVKGANLESYQSSKDEFDKLSKIAVSKKSITEA